MSNNKDTLSLRIKQLAKSHGFTDCGIAPAEHLHDDAERLRQWLDEGMHAGMKYMENYFDKRTDPSKLVPGAKSVIVLLLNYLPPIQQDENTYKIAKYAHGQDYHFVVKGMLRSFQQEINKMLISHAGRAFVDSAPVLERSLAAKAGLGWIGKNANLISPKNGSFLFIAELITDIELTCDKLIPDYCGGCTKCLQACPTGAIIDSRRIDSNKCISYWTIEHKGAINEMLKGKFNDWIFGCDICQDVCPWNRKAQVGEREEFRSGPDLLAMAKSDWKNISVEKYRELFKRSPVKRTKFEGLKRNINFLSDREANE